MGNEVSPETLRFMDKQDKFNNKLYDGLSDIKQTLSGMKEELIGIHEQTKKTNGRVNALEKWKGENDEFIQNSKISKLANDKRLWDYIWKIGFIIIVGILSIINFIK